jgi:hypothetical protein
MSAQEKVYSENDIIPINFEGTEAWGDNYRWQPGVYDWRVESAKTRSDNGKNQLVFGLRCLKNVNVAEGASDSAVDQLLQHSFNLDISPDGRSVGLNFLHGFVKKLNPEAITKAGLRLSAVFGAEIRATLIEENYTDKKTQAQKKTIRVENGTMVLLKAPPVRQPAAQVVPAGMTPAT